MTVEPILALIVAAVVANLVVMVVLVVSPGVQAARGRSSVVDRSDVKTERQMAAAAVVGGAQDRVSDEGVSARAYDRVVRIVSWTFLLATTTIVARLPYHLIGE